MRCFLAPGPLLAGKWHASRSVHHTLVGIFLAVTLTRLIHANQLNGDAQINAIGVVFDIVITHVTVCVSDSSNPAQVLNTLRTEQQHIRVILRKDLPPGP